MDKFVELALVFGPQIIFIFLIAGFIKQDIGAIFLTPRYENPVFVKLANHLYLFTGFILVSIIVLPVSIMLYLNNQVDDFYDIARLLIAGNGLVFFIAFFVNYLFYNVSYNKGQITHKTFLGSTAFYADKITEVKLKKGIFFPVIVLISDKREITFSSFCVNTCTLLYLIRLDNEKVITKPFLDKLFQVNKVYKKETEVINLILEVRQDD